MMESGPVFTAKNSVHEKEAKAIAKWWMSPEGSRHFAKVFQSYSANTKVGESHLPPAKKELLSGIKKQDCRILNRYWEATPTCISETAIEAFSRFILDPGQKEAVLTEIEQAAQSFWKDRP
jgi:multiple sugar transport system substrate-binding protein